MRAPSLVGQWDSKTVTDLLHDCGVIVRCVPAPIGLVGKSEENDTITAVPKQCATCTTNRHVPWTNCTA